MKRSIPLAAALALVLGSSSIALAQPGPGGGHGNGKGGATIAKAELAGMVLGAAVSTRVKVVIMGPMEEAGRQRTWMFVSRDL